MDYVFQFGEVTAHAGDLARGAAVTLGLTAAATVLGTAIGLGGAVCRRARARWLSWPAMAYVELFRNTPFLVQIFFIYFGLPGLGLKLNGAEAAVLGLSVSLGAYATEIIRAGLDAVGQGQIEAGLSLGLSRLLVFWLVVLRPALAAVYPALTSQVVLIMLGSAAVSQISVRDLTFVAEDIQASDFRAFEVYIVTTLLYLALAIAVRQALRFAGRGLAIPGRS